MSVVIALITQTISIQSTSKISLKSARETMLRMQQRNPAEPFTASERVHLLGRAVATTAAGY